MSPLFPNLALRDRRPELMDDPALDESLHRQALKGLERVNWISGIPGLLWRTIRPLCDEVRDRPVRVLDVGSGGGDISVKLWKKAAAAGNASRRSATATARNIGLWGQSCKSGRLWGQSRK